LFFAPILVIVFTTTVQVYHSAAEKRQGWMLCAALQDRLLPSLSFHFSIRLGVVGYKTERKQRTNNYYCRAPGNLVIAAAL